MNPMEIFGDIPVVVVGGVATRAYAPDRHTKDIGFLVAHERYQDALQRLNEPACQRTGALFFPNTSLSTARRVKKVESRSMSLQPTNCGRMKLYHKVYDQTGIRVIALPYLVLMKLDSAR
ncbi:MAG: hypothetical protein ABI182_04055 [Candidatus Baltobacteraceae bacterium]